MVDDCVIVAEGTSLRLLITVVGLLKTLLAVELYDAVVNTLLVLITVVWLLRVLLDDEPYDAVMYTLLALVSEIDSRG